MSLSRRSTVVLLMLLALGLAMRTFGAWVYEYAHTSDHGIICLMVKHMLEGKDFPVFFYGLPYMGSIEPSISAGLCYLFGLTGFWINMGTALAAFAFLPLVYLWGRGAAGLAGGLAALAFCVIGPPQYFQFESWADGGYAAIPLLTCALLVYGLRLLARDLEGQPPGHLQFALLGVIAGLGWWQSPLLIPAFLVCALLFLLVLRLRLFSLRLISGGAGFVLGSLPLWIWNIRNHWQTFDMVKTHDRPSLLEGLRLFYVNRLSSLLEFHRGTDLFRYAMAGLLIALALLALVQLIASWRKAKRAEALYLSAALLYIVIYSILFGRSRFARVDAVRYVLILIPILGVLAGAATAWLTDRFRILGWIPLVALLALQAKELPKRLPERERTAAFIPKAEKLGEFLKANDIRHLYTDYQVRGANHGLNFLLNEEFVFSPVSRERVRPYARALEQAESPAVLNNVMGFSSFLKMTGASCETNEVAGQWVQYHVRPPSDGWRFVSWGPLNQAKEAGWVKATKTGTAPALISGVRLLCEPEAYPSALGVDSWDEATEKWTVLVSDTPVTRYFWSGPRFYWGGSAFRLECRFEPVLTKTIRVRMKIPRNGTLRLRDLLPMTPDSGERVPGDSDLKQLADWIQSNGLKRVYADRWEANRLLSRVAPEVKLSLQPYIFGRETLPPVMELDGQTAVMVRSREKELEALSLKTGLVPYQETSLGPWTVFTFPGTLPPPSSRPVLRWQGFGSMPASK